MRKHDVIAIFMNVAVIYVLMTSMTLYMYMCML